MKEIITKVSKSVIPTKSLEKSKKEIANLAFKLVEIQIKKFPEVIGLEFGGSFAKGTWLPQNADVDIFIKFKKETSEENFEKISKKIGFSSMKSFNPYVRYSEHPYVEAKIKGTKINVVPCYDVKLGNWKSSADRSPFHTKNIKNILTPKMKNEVRLLKTFLQAMNIYGAEMPKQGFSGYVSEVLIVNFGSFENVIKSIAKIKENQIIGTASKKFSTPGTEFINIKKEVFNWNDLLGCYYIMVPRIYFNYGYIHNDKVRIMLGPVLPRTKIESPGL